MRSIYNYDLLRGENFHRNADNEKNILLICLTEENQIVGAFSSAGFSLRGEVGRTSAFLFNFKGDDFHVYPLKPGKASTYYDWDFLLFGNEELCIESGTNILTSYFVAGPKNALNYERGPHLEYETFLSK